MNTEADTRCDQESCDEDEALGRDKALHCSTLDNLHRRVVRDKESLELLVLSKVSEENLDDVVAGRSFRDHLGSLCDHLLDGLLHHLLDGLLVRLLLFLELWNLDIENPLPISSEAVVLRLLIFSVLANRMHEVARVCLAVHLEASSTVAAPRDTKLLARVSIRASSVRALHTVHETAADLRLLKRRKMLGSRNGGHF